MRSAPSRATLGLSEQFKLLGWFERATSDRRGHQPERARARVLPETTRIVSQFIDMNRQTENKIVLVTRMTRWMEMMIRHGTPGQARYFLGSRKLNAAAYQEESEQFDEALSQTSTILSKLGRVQHVIREHLPNFLFGPDDIVVVLGQDGLVANTLKYTEGQPVIGVNPDPRRYDGILLPFEAKYLRQVVIEVFARMRPLKSVTMAEARLNDGRSMRAVNDLFIGPKSHTSARYEIRSGQQAEDQSSSGVIVSTGMGSTGWFRSLLAGATGIVESYGYGQARIAQQAMPMAARKKMRFSSAGAPATRGRGEEGADDVRFTELFDSTELREINARYYSMIEPPKPPKFDGSFPWDARHLCFTVREPFPTKTTGANLVYGRVAENQPLVITSQMPENGVIFSDGIEADFLEFNSGDVASIGLSERVGRLVM